MKCFHCGEGHMTTKCPELHSPLKDGFYSGGGGGAGHSHEEEDEISKNGFKSWKICIQYPKSKNKSKCRTTIPSSTTIPLAL